MSTDKTNTVALRLSPELASAINKKRGEAFNSGSELSKHDVIVGTLCAAFGVPFTPGQKQGRPSNAAE